MQFLKETSAFRLEKLFKLLPQQPGQLHLQNAGILFHSLMIPAIPAARQVTLIIIRQTASPTTNIPGLICYNIKLAYQTVMGTSKNLLFENACGFSRQKNGKKHRNTVVFRGFLSVLWPERRLADSDSGVFRSALI